MKFFFTFCILTICSVGRAQINLVPNPSFEDTISCPNSGGQVWKAKYWETVAFTPDYFHACNPFWQFSVPYNTVGYQWPNSGEAYMGLWAYSASGPTAREIIGSNLSSMLSIGQKYFVNFKVNVAFKVSAGSNAACNNLGVLFSTVKYLNNSFVITNACQVKADSILNDSINWVSVKGSFIADSAYSFIAIGNFYSNANTDTMHLAYSNTHQAYYYIDDVCLSTDSLYCELFTGLPEGVKSGNLLVYPIPASDKIMIDNMPFGCFLIEMISIDGTLVNQIKIDGSFNATLNISSLPEGIYLLKFNTYNSIITQKFIKSNN
jgi:hypothetical protein